MILMFNNYANLLIYLPFLYFFMNIIDNKHRYIDKNLKNYKFNDI